MKTFAEANEALRRFWSDKSEGSKGSPIETIIPLLDYLGNPQDALQVVHVAGTSGKTSTAYYVAALLKAAGKKVGLTVSPHVDEVNERVQINGTPLNEVEFCQELTVFLDLVEKSGVQASYFTALTAFAFWEFARQGVEYAVVEVGIGGLTDATNVISRPDKVCVITSIGLDHLGKLGPTLSDVARHKAGIIQPHNAAFCYQQAPEIMQPVIERAEQQNADLHVLEESAAESKIDFLPLFQQRNLGLAHATVNYMLIRSGGPALTDAAVREAAQVYIPGRMEAVQYDGRTVILDVAHNAQKLHALAESVRRKYPGQKVAAVVSLVRSKDYRLENSAEELVPLLDHVIITTFSSPDYPHSSTNDDNLAKVFTDQGARSVEVIDDPEAALQALLERPEPVLLVTGSFFLLSRVRPLLGL